MAILVGQLIEILKQFDPDREVVIHTLKGENVDVNGYFVQKDINDTNFYLTEKVDGIDKYNYNLLDNDEIIEVYDNLGNPFDIIHKIKVQADLKDDLRD